MEDGLKAANNEVILYLDGDVRDLPDDLVQRMCDPILAGDADFVKAAFTRARGRVTTLTARPLLRIFSPNWHISSNPSGESSPCARRSWKSCASKPITE